MIIIFGNSHVELRKACAGKPGSNGMSTLTDRHLSCFKGAKLAVLVSLLLGSNDEGWSVTDVLQLERETGYTKHTIETSLSSLCRLELGRRRLMLMVPERKRAGLPNKLHCRIFPTDADIQRYEKKCRRAVSVASATAD